MEGVITLTGVCLFFIASNQFEIGFWAGGQERLFLKRFLKLQVTSKHPKWPDKKSYKMFPFLPERLRPEDAAFSHIKSDVSYNDDSSALCGFVKGLRGACIIHFTPPHAVNGAKHLVRCWRSQRTGGRITHRVWECANLPRLCFLRGADDLWSPYEDKKQ